MYSALNMDVNIYQVEFSLIKIKILILIYRQAKAEICQLPISSFCLNYFSHDLNTEMLTTCLWPGCGPECAGCGCE